MRADNVKCEYKSSDLSLTTINSPVYYPINALLGKTISINDEIRPMGCYVDFLKYYIRGELL